MDSILDSRKIILQNIENVFNEYINRENNINKKNKEYIEEINELSTFNKKLLEEVNEKDKQLLINDKKMVDYEIMINKIQEEASKELTEKERFSMLKAKDKAIDERDIEIRRLQKKVDILEKQLVNMKNTNIEIVIEEKDKLVDGPKEVETEVVDGPEEVETEVVDGEDTEDISSEEGEEVEIITHYKKEFYIIVGEIPQYIYAIEDGSLGEKVGELTNGRKKFYKSSKN
jgi:hypothetical protein